MTMNLTTVRLLIAAGLAAGVGTAASAKIYAEYNGAAGIRNGFEGGEFGTTTYTQLGPISLDVSSDTDGSDGFGGFIGADMSARFDVANTELQVNLTIDPTNVVDTLAVHLKDLDGNFTGDSFTYFFDLAGQPTGVPITLTRPLSEAPGTVGTGGGLFPGDGIENYGVNGLGLDQIFLTAGYPDPNAVPPVSGTDPLNISLDSIRIVDPSDPTFFELDTDTYNNSTRVGSFTFENGALGGGAVDATGQNFIVNATTGSDGGGYGIGGLPNYEFDADTHELQITAKLLGGNTVNAFRVVLGDVDGDDTGPGAGGENYFFDLLTDGFNATDFTTVTIPLGDGTQTDSGDLFGFTNAGDDLQNFDLNALSFRVLGEDGDTLNIELATIAIVEAIQAGIDGDYNNSGQVEQGDLDLVLQNWGLDTDANGVPTGWTNDLPSGQIEQTELDGVLQNWGNTAAPDFSGGTVPEPASLALLGATGLLALRRRRAV